MVSIITPAYNNPSQLENFLGSVVSSPGLHPDHEIIVVDDGSAHDMKAVTDKFKGVRYIRLGGRSGPSIARNRGAKEARGEFLIFFDSDVMLKPDTLIRFEERFKSGDLAVVGEYDIKPIEDSFFPRFKALMEESWMSRDKYVSIFLLRAAGIRRDVFEKVGGFDENIKTASVEDYEFADRLKKIGVKICYDPEILVRHHHPTFIKQMKVFYLRAKDWADIFLKRRGRFDNFCATPAEGLASLAGSVFAFFLILSIIARMRLLILVAAASLILYLILNYKFMCVVYRRKGLLFVPLALLVKLPLSIAITAGFKAGMLRALWRKIKIK